jgi:hypothetical protein
MSSNLEYILAVYVLAAVLLTGFAAWMKWRLAQVRRALERLRPSEEEAEEKEQ